MVAQRRKLRAQIVAPSISELVHTHDVCFGSTDNTSGNKPVQFGFTERNLLMFMCVNGKLGIKIGKSFRNNFSCLRGP